MMKLNLKNNLKLIKTYQLFLEELVGEKPISDLDSYISGMNLSISDKLFFINKIDFDVIVDFGCADGTFLKELSKIKPDVKLIGYDLDDTMLKKAKVILPKNSLITSDWSIIVKELSKYKTPLLNLSSVIHEVYSYSHSSMIKIFWEKQVFGNNFKYITIRDMMPSVEIYKSDINQFKNDVIKVKQKSNKKILNSFENKWGIIDDNYKTFMHYLLKYKYIENWDREVNENYLPVSIEVMKTKIPKSYQIIFEDNYILPFIKNQIKTDFGIDLLHTTHTKMIIKNNKFKK